MSYTSAVVTFSDVVLDPTKGLPMEVLPSHMRSFSTYQFQSVTVINLALGRRGNTTIPSFIEFTCPTSFALLNQVDVWKVDDIDLLSKFNDFKYQQAQSRFSLALDGIADVTPGSTFSRALSVKERSLASVVSLKSIDENWHSHYLEYHDEVPRTINEREGFGDLTWPFIRGALKLVKIPSRCFEIPVIGTKERRNTGRDLSVETEEQAPMADGVAVFEDYQIYLAEASTIYDAKSEKEAKDKFKL
ncbi:hypothetical protein BGX23_001890, partial [Mortierella sp. AD031]